MKNKLQKAIIHRKRLVLESLCNKVAVAQACNSIKNTHFEEHLRTARRVNIKITCINPCIPVSYMKMMLIFHQTDKLNHNVELR